MKKRTLSFALAVMLCLGMFAAMPLTASAAESSTANTFVVGNNYSLAVKTDGTLWGWAWDGNTAGRPQVGPITVGKTTPVKLMDNVVSVHALSIYHSAVLKNDATLWYIPVRRGSPVKFETPVKIADSVKSVEGSPLVGDILGEGSYVIKTDSVWEITTSGGVTTPVVKIEEHQDVWNNMISSAYGGGIGGTGYDDRYGLSTYIVKTDGSLWAWGKNSWGQIGNGSTDDVSAPVKIMDNVVAVSASNGHAAAVTSNGTLYAWGTELGTVKSQSAGGDMGVAVTATYNVNISPKMIMDGVKSVFCTTHTNYVIKSDQSLWYWGGGGISEFFSQTPSPVKLLDNVLSVQANAASGFAIKTDNTLWAWGDNAYGQMGNGTRDDIAKPQQVLDNVMSVKLGAHSLAIKKDGSLWGTGNVLRGELEQSVRDKPVFVQFSNSVKLPAATTPPTPAIPTLTATPTASTVLVNGENVAFDAYNIGGNNYFKLRDLAYALSGTEKQFEVGFDGSIILTSGKPYTSDGSEMKAKGAGNKTPVPTSSKIYLDGKEVKFTAYNIEGNNYFKLRDIGAAFDFGVTWDGVNNTIVIDASIGYTPG